MKQIDLLSFAVKTRPPYFSSGVDIEVYEKEEEVWVPLRDRPYSLTTLVEELQSGGIDSTDIRFAEDGVERYLYHLSVTSIDESIHYHRLMNRDRLIALADAGYTSPDTFLQTSDTVDISKETGIDRSVISDVGSSFVGGFDTASSLSGGLLTDITPQDDFEGWDLTENTTNRIRWTTDGGFRLTITPAPDRSIVVQCNAPDDERHPWYRKGWSPDVSVDSESPTAALTAAHSWLAAHELRFMDTLTDLPRIGPATRDYLALKYGISSEADIREFATEQPDEFNDIFGQLGQKLRDAL